MGDIARANVAERFINQFNADAIARYAWPELPAYVSGSLNYDHDSGEVKFYMLLKWNDREEEVCLDYPVFFLSEMPDDIADRVADVFGMEMSVVREKLSKVWVQNNCIKCGEELRHVIVPDSVENGLHETFECPNCDK